MASVCSPEMMAWAAPQLLGFLISEAKHWALHLGGGQGGTRGWVIDKACNLVENNERKVMRAPWARVFPGNVTVINCEHKNNSCKWWVMVR